MDQPGPHVAGRYFPAFNRHNCKFPIHVAPANRQCGASGNRFGTNGMANRITGAILLTDVIFAPGKKQ